MKFNTKPCEEKMQKSVAAYESNLSTIRASQANSAIVSKVMFEYYGAPTKLVDMASVAVTDPKTLTITPYDRSTLKAMVKALLASDIGITPNNDGSVIRLVFPELTEERRKDLVKDVKKKGEEAKVAVRNIRRDANDAFKKLAKEDISEDEIKDLEKEVQKLTDKYIKDIEKAVDDKSKEILTV